MATLREIGIKNYCDSVFTELSTMKSKLLGFVGEIEQMKGHEKEALQAHIPHFNDIINTIDWKLEILMKVCPFEWAGYPYDVEDTTSVPAQREPFEKEPVSGGYIGG